MMSAGESDNDIGLSQDLERSNKERMRRKKKRKTDEVIGVDAKRQANNEACDEDQSNVGNAAGKVFNIQMLLKSMRVSLVLI